MQALAHTGLMRVDPFSTDNPTRIYDPRWIGSIDRYFRELYQKHYKARGGGPDTFVDFYENFMAQAVRELYHAGEVEEAQKLLEQLDASGVTSIFQFGVDNVLCHVADPTFVGFCSARHADCASKTVPKRDAHEPVGVVALAGGRPAVVEYSEISREMAEAKDAHGRLLFGDAHICVNFFSVPFLKSFCARLGPFGIQLPLHVAHKKIPYTDASGTRRTPTSNNGIKLELFIFDTFPFAKQMAALQVARDEEFAPVKNEPGAKSDSPDTARALVSALSKRRILAAGGAIRGDAIVELSPMASYQGEGLADRVAGRTFSTPVHLE
jgi:UDP-N-acetylglucosamine/UDP-N-acetylgalactosamine diphosphorylase